MKLKDFKDEFRLVCHDTWGTAMEVWFEACGQLNKRDEIIPSEWEYRPGLCGDGTNEESYWYEIFENASTEELWAIANLMMKYCELLKLKGVDY